MGGGLGIPGNTLKTLNSMSPTNLKITLEQVRRAKATHTMSLGECLKMGIVPF
jgi:hypothetical protein